MRTPSRSVRVVTRKQKKSPQTFVCGCACVCVCVRVCVACIHVCPQQAPVRTRIRTESALAKLHASHVPPLVFFCVGFDLKPANVPGLACVFVACGGTTAWPNMSVAVPRTAARPQQSRNAPAKSACASSTQRGTAIYSFAFALAHPAPSTQHRNPNKRAANTCGS